MRALGLARKSDTYNTRKRYTSTKNSLPSSAVLRKGSLSHFITISVRRGWMDR
jgi:hypothetical protein